MADTENKTEEKAPEAPAGGGVSWEGAAEEMFERMIQEVPESLHEVFRGKLMGVVAAKAQGGPATADIIVEIVNEMVPEPFKSAILKAYSTMGGGGGAGNHSRGRRKKHRDSARGSRGVRIHSGGGAAAD